MPLCLLTLLRVFQPVSDCRFRIKIDDGEVRALNYFGRISKESMREKIDFSQLIGWAYAIGGSVKYILYSDNRYFRGARFITDVINMLPVERDFQTPGAVLVNSSFGCIRRLAYTVFKTHARAQEFGIKDTLKTRCPRTTARMWEVGRSRKPEPRAVQAFP
jgi:hypothetical protein